MAEPTPKPASQPERPVTTVPSSVQLEAPTLYFNGFAVSIGNADFTIVLNLDNVPAIKLKCSFTEAKSLAEKLKLAIEHFEKATNYNLLTADDVRKALQQSAVNK